jgi:ubiquinone/menaquinone biosynthesis C-methylase UbiE
MIYKPTEPAVDELFHNRKRQMERNALFLEHGIDRDKAINFIIDSAGPLRTPVLDIGTGKGMAAIEMARRGVPVTSIDVSETELQTAFLNARAAEVDSSIRFYIGDAKELPFEGDQFNLVTMINVLHHVDEVEGIFTEVSRVLAPGGRFLIADFTNDGFRILDRIHRSEGHRHDRMNAVEMDDVAGILQGFGLECRGRDARFHEHVILAEKV